nr:MAG TPA: hypothetical protein [Caudoviricetes sp.]
MVLSRAYPPAKNFREPISLGAGCPLPYAKCV